MEQEEPLIKIGEYLDLRNHTNKDLMRVIKQLKACISDYKLYDSKQKEFIRQCNIKIGVQNSRISHQKKAITDLLKAINSNESKKINEKYILEYLDNLYAENIEEAQRLKDELRMVKIEFGNCKAIFRNEIGITYEEWIGRAKNKKG